MTDLPHRPAGVARACAGTRGVLPAGGAHRALPPVRVRAGVPAGVRAGVRADREVRREPVGRGAVR
ncbi:hypothetical protein, partial [Actinomycetospora chibensis]